MEKSGGRIIKTYVTLTLFSTFASSFIWGINTLFLLDAGLSITETFAANAFFTLGQVLFEIPPGVVADTRGRRLSFLLGTVTLFASTLAYLWLWQTSGPFWTWAIVSMLLGLGFTFFSGATEAWLVDGLDAAGFKGKLENVFAKGSVASGIAMLTGTLAGGFIAEATNLGVPYILRVIALGLTFVIALFLMHDEGFTPRKRGSLVGEMREVLRSSMKYGIGNPPVRWMMLSSFFSGGVVIYAFYAMQPYLLELYGESASYGIAGIAAAIVAGSQILGGLVAPFAEKVFKKRTTILITGTAISTAALILVAVVGNFWLVLVVLSIWSVVFAAMGPIRQAYVNGLLPSEQRATVLSSDSLLNAAGGVIVQPTLGRAAELWGYPASYIGSAIFQIIALPFIALARRENAKSDPIHDKAAATVER